MRETLLKLKIFCLAALELFTVEVQAWLAARDLLRGRGSKMGLEVDEDLPPAPAAASAAAVACGRQRESSACIRWIAGAESRP